VTASFHSIDINNPDGPIVARNKQIRRRSGLARKRLLRKESGKQTKTKNVENVSNFRQKTDKRLILKDLSLPLFLTFNIIP